MNYKAKKVHYQKIVKHETKRHVLIKFLLVLAVFIGYFVFISFQYGLEQGLLVALLTWSFFVLCTPVADAGFLIDFPLRLIMNIRMFVLEIIVWSIAISLNLYAFFLRPEIYDKTKMLILFKHIIEQPFPFWIIIFISALGTFISIQFGDELLDQKHHKKRDFYHKNKHTARLVIMIFIFGMILITYDFLLKKLGVDMPI